MDTRDTLHYGKKDLINPQSTQTVTNTTHTYYPINDQLEYVESRIVTENNSSLVSAINLNSNKLSAYQRSIQSNHQNYSSAHQTQLFNPQNHYQSSNHHASQKLSRPSSNKITITNENHPFLTSQQRNQQPSLSKRNGSVTRVGIKVVSRNSSMQKKSQTSVQRSTTSKDLKNRQNDVNQEKQPNTALCGLNCTTRNPFIQNQQTNEMTIIPNLGSLQTLKSGITSSHQPYSQRQHLNNQRNPAQQKFHKNFYDNVSQRTHIEPSNNYLLNHKNHSQLMKENFSGNGNNLQKVYKQVREMMEKEILVAKKMYQKKYLDQIQCLNACYKSQIQTLQRVLGQNLTVIQEQGTKICKLQNKIHKKQAKTQKYSQRFDSLIKFIQKSNKFALQRIDEVQKKFIILLSQFQSFHVSPSDTIALQNKLTYLQQIFSSVVVKTIMKYRSIEWQIKQQVKEMMKKYDYYEEKIYEMDLMKHLGKQNQIQNYRLIQSIEGIKEKLVILESKANIRSQIREINTGVDIGNQTTNNQMRNFNRVEQLKRMISTMQYKLGNLEQENTETSIKMYKLESVKSLLDKKVSTLEHELSVTKKELIKFRNQRDQLLSERQNYLAQRNQYQLQRDQHHQQKVHQSPQKPFTNAYNIEMSSQKKSANDEQLNRDQMQQIRMKQMKRQVQRLQEIIDQYEAKIQQLHDAIQNLEKQNTVLITALNNKTTNQEKQKQIINNKLNQQSSIDQLLVDKLNNQLLQKNQLLQQWQFSLDQLTKEKLQLQQALQTTQHIFDQQISKFKQTIRLLQQQNTQLLVQINDIRQGHNLAESASSTKSNIHKVTLAKSPKKEMCQTVTMGWFKKNLSSQQPTLNGNNHKNFSDNNTINENQNYTQKSSPINPKTNLSSPINQYYMDNNYNGQNRINEYQYRDKIKQQSNGCIQQQQSAQQGDEFFYPQSMKNKMSSRGAIDSSSILQSQQNITPYYQSKNANTHTSFNQPEPISGKSFNSKLQKKKINKQHQTSSPSNIFYSYNSQALEENGQQEEPETYIF